MRKYEELTREELQKIVSESTSISEVLRKLNLVDRGDNHTTFKKFLVDNGYDMSTLVGRAIYRGAEHPIPRTLQEMLVENGTRDSNKLKLKLIRYGIKKEMCENPLCEIPHREENMWAGEPVTLELHHINGIHTDNRLENLILLCPLCHSQTKNFRGKNSKATEESQRLKLLKQAASECAEKAIPIIIQNAIDKQNGISYQRKFEKKNQFRKTMVIV